MPSTARATSKLKMLKTQAVLAVTPVWQNNEPWTNIEIAAAEDIPEGNPGRGVNKSAGEELKMDENSSQNLADRRWNLYWACEMM